MGTEYLCPSQKGLVVSMVNCNLWLAGIAPGLRLSCCRADANRFRFRKNCTCHWRFSRPWPAAGVEFLDRGAKVAISARDPEELDSGGDQLRKVTGPNAALEADMTMREEVESAVQKFEDISARWIFSLIMRAPFV